MPQVSEKWKLCIGKAKHIISGEEVKVILGAGDVRFIRFRDLVINPAFIEQMVLIKTNAPRIEGPDEKDLSSKEWLANHIYT